MRAIPGAVCFVLMSAPAWAACPSVLSHCAGPAPVLGLGLPAAVAVAAALCGARFFKTKK